MSSNQPFDAETRRRTLQEYWRYFERTLPGGFYPPEHAQRSQDLLREYFNGLPIVPLSRCPYCKTVIQLVMDTFDLDGLWWNYGQGHGSAPDETSCPHLWMLSGAVRLSQSITVSDCWVHPGPELPFVIPQVLNDHPIKVVISQVPVGRHIAYPMIYFTEKKTRVREQTIPRVDYGYISMDKEWQNSAVRNV